MRIVVDSTMDLSEDLRKFVRIVPLKVDIGGDVFKDGERKLEDVFEEMRMKNVFAKTSQPSPEEFRRVYEEELRSGDWILSIHISEKLSGTISSARMAAREFPGKVFVFDSKAATIVAQIYVREALKCDGCSPKEVLRKLEEIRERVELYLTVGELEFLKRSGRLKGIEAIIGSLLKLRPLIEVVDGALRTKKVHRSSGKVLKEMMKLMEGAKEVIIGHILAEDIAAKLLDHANAIGVRAQVIPVRSCALSVHLGPGSYGIALRK